MSKHVKIVREIGSCCMIPEEYDAMHAAADRLEALERECRVMRKALWRISQRGIRNSVPMMNGHEEAGAALDRIAAMRRKAAKNRRGK